MFSIVYSACECILCNDSEILNLLLLMIGRRILVILVFITVNNSKTGSFPFEPPLKALRVNPVRVQYCRRSFKVNVTEKDPSQMICPMGIDGEQDIEVI